MPDSMLSERLMPVPSPAEIAYGRFVPLQFLQLLRRHSIVDVKLGDFVEREMTLLFSSIRDFTSLSESILPAENFRFINSYFSTMEPVVTRNSGIIDKYIGDGIMALFPGSAEDSVRAGIDMIRQLVNYNEGRMRAGYMPIRIGIGINTGLVIMGTVGGHNRMDGTVIGDAVNVASRLEGLTKDYGTPLLMSAHTLHAIPDYSVYCIRFIDRLQIKGRFQAQAVYEVFDVDPEPLRLAKLQTLQMFEDALAFYYLGRADEAQPLFEECLRIAPDDRTVRVYLERCKESARSGIAVGALSAGMKINWRKEYAVGIRGIDTQHQELFLLMSDLMKQLSGWGARTGFCLDNIAGQVDAIFNSEENLMQRYAYPFAKEHLHQHATFKRFFAELRAEIEANERGRYYLLFRIQLLLVDWQINHISKSNLHLGNFLQRAGVS
ncbi:MAG: guanylate cyclase [Proteobacteria bacterium]|nr:guanylate cyclase [Pseudomonadota bacterium]